MKLDMIIIEKWDLFNIKVYQNLFFLVMNDYSSFVLLFSFSSVITHLESSLCKP